MQTLYNNETGLHLILITNHESEFCFGKNVKCLVKEMELSLKLGDFLPWLQNAG